MNNRINIDLICRPGAPTRRNQRPVRAPGLQKALRFRWKVILALFLLTSVVHSAEIDPARSQALLKTLQSADSSFYQKARACQQAGEFGTAELVPSLAALLDDEKLSAYARSGLENIPGPEAKAALRSALSTLKGDLLAGVIDSIADWRDVNAVPALQKLAADPQSGVAGRALTALGSIADDSSIKILQKALKSGPAETRPDAASGLLLSAQRRLQEGDTGTAVKLCDEVLAAKLPANLHAAAVHGAILARGIKDSDYLVAQLTSADPEIRRAALLAVQSFPVGELAKVLFYANDKAKSDNKALLDNALQVLCFKPLITGRSFYGWEGDVKKSFRREDDAIVGGNLEEPVPRNEFLATTREYTNFVLRAECKIIGEKCNAGIQFRTQRIPDHYEVTGYQADMSMGEDGGYWGKLYDESRRKKILGESLNRPEMIKTLKADDWNQYEIRCEGPQIQLFVNGIQTLDYTEPDASIPQSGIIAVQIHSGPASEAWYRNIQIVELP